MSAEASAAVLKHAQGSDAEWRMLALLADAANPRGVVSGLSLAELAERMGRTEKGVSGVKGRLLKSGQLEELEKGGGRGRSAVYAIKLPGLTGPEPPAEKGGSAPDTPPAEGGNGAAASNTGQKKASSSKDPRADFRQELRDADVPDEMVADGEEFLGRKRKVNSQIVTPAEMAIAAAALAAYNREFEWDGRKGSEVGLGSALTPIVMRIREHPSWDAAKHVRLVESAWRFRWWEQSDRKRRPTPNVIWSDKSFPEVVQDAKEEHEGKKKSERHYTRKRDRGQEG